MCFFGEGFSPYQGSDMVIINPLSQSSLGYIPMMKLTLRSAIGETLCSETRRHWIMNDPVFLLKRAPDVLSSPWLCSQLQTSFAVLPFSVFS